MAKSKIVRFGVVGCVTLTLILTSCVRRTMHITTTPPSALVHLNGQEIGRSEVSVDFIWYGDYNIEIKHEGFETLQTNWDVKPPWYQHVPLDFFAEVLWAGKIHDVHAKHFELQPEVLPTSEELTQRAAELQARAVNSLE